jgi:hypothetical protein
MLVALKCLKDHASADTLNAQAYVLSSLRKTPHWDPNDDQG